MKLIRNIFASISIIDILILLTVGFSQEMRNHKTVIEPFYSIELENTLGFIGLYLLPIFLLGFLITLVLEDRNK